MWFMCFMNEFYFVVDSVGANCQSGWGKNEANESIYKKVHWTKSNWRCRVDHAKMHYNQQLQIDRWVSKLCKSRFYSLFGLIRKSKYFICHCLKVLGEWKHRLFRLTDALGAKANGSLLFECRRLLQKSVSVHNVWEMVRAIKDFRGYRIVYAKVCVNSINYIATFY
jgi:hypothetical protein